MGQEFIQENPMDLLKYSEKYQIDVAGTIILQDLIHFQQTTCFL